MSPTSVPCNQPDIGQDGLLLRLLEEPHAGGGEDVERCLLVLLLGDVFAGKVEEGPEVLEGVVWGLPHAGEAGGHLPHHGLPVLQHRGDLEQLVAVTAVLRPSGGLGMSRSLIASECTLIHLTKEEN